MVLHFKKLRPSVADDSVNCIYFEPDCVVYPKHGFDSADILHLITFFSFILQKLYFMQTRPIIPTTVTWGFFSLSLDIFIFCL